VTKANDIAALVVRANAAGRDERLADGQLYLDCAAALESQARRIAELEEALKSILSGLARQSIDYDCGDVEYTCRAALSSGKGETT
jgi:hypothetical protein